MLGAVIDGAGCQRLLPPAPRAIWCLVREPNAVAQVMFELRLVLQFVLGAMVPLRGRRAVLGLVAVAAGPAWRYEGLAEPVERMGTILNMIKW